MIPRSRLVAAYAVAAQHYASAGNVEATMENLAAMILVEIAGRGTRLGDAPKSPAAGYCGVHRRRP